MTLSKTKDEFGYKCRSPLIYVTILLFLLLLYVIDIKQLDIKPLKLLPSVRIDRHEGFIIKTTGCRIPYLDPFDKTILKYIFRVKPFTCGSAPSLISSNLTSVFVEYDAFPYYNISYWDNIQCCYQPFWRVNPAFGQTDNIYRHGDCKSFHSSAIIRDEFVKVKCKINNTLIYKDYFSFVPKKKSRVPQRSKESFTVGTDKLNVMFVGLDAISRLNFIRQMPHTYSFLKNDLKTIEFIGYNKVADNTFPNLIPILTGLSEEELRELCWPSNSEKFDDCPFIWKNFTQSGYITSFAEDSSWMGVFNYLKKGFEHQPTDYYWKTFNYLAEKDIGHTKPYNADLCLGTRPIYLVLIEYMLRFVMSMGNKPFFSFFWGTSLSHDNLNFPAIGDDNYLLFFKKLFETNVLNQTVLVVISDHGIRWGDIRSTHQGQLEERLPFLFFKFPHWFQTKYSSAVANLRKNTRRLTTPYDLHETLKDILNLPNILPNNIKVRTRNELNKRGISLFLNIPDNRTCATANISAHWCTCQTSIEVNLNDSIVVRAANFIVNRIHNLLEGFKACAKLKLNSILDARLMKTDNYLKNDSMLHDYTLIIQTFPGGGQFEATVRCFSCNENDPFQITGTISRINLYGNQSNCITDFHLKLYCFCGG